MKNILLVLFMLFFGSTISMAQDYAFDGVLPAEFSKMPDAGMATLTVQFKVVQKIGKDIPYELFFSRGTDDMVSQGTGVIDGAPNVDIVVDFKYNISFAEHAAGDTVLLNFAVKVQDDDEPENDTFRIKYRVVEANNRDLKITLDQATLNSEFETYSEVTLDFDIENTGLITFKTSKFFQLNIKKDTTIIHTVDSILYNGPWITRRTSGKTSAVVPIGREIPLGESDLCFELIWALYSDSAAAISAEETNENNATCAKINMVLGSIGESGIAPFSISQQGNMLWVDFENTQSTIGHTLEVINISGQVMATQNLGIVQESDSRRGVSTATLPKGLYIARVQSGDSVLGVQKFLIQK